MPDPKAQIDLRKLKPRRYSDSARVLLEHVWTLMGMPCGKYLQVKLPIWLPLLTDAGDLDGVTGETVAELEAMSPATMDRYLAPARARMRLAGISTTKPTARLLRNLIMIRTSPTNAPPCLVRSWLTSSPAAA